MNGKVKEYKYLKPDLIDTYEYNPWGVLLTSASKNNLLYTSREFDFETGLQFNRMRYYLPNLGRFSQKDLIFCINCLAYADNDPINYVDPKGLSIFACIRYVIYGGYCTYNTLQQCRECCLGEYNKNMAACSCPAYNDDCAAAAGARLASCWRDCNTEYR